MTPRQNAIARAFFEGASPQTLADIIERPKLEVEAIIRQWMRDRDKRKAKP